MDLAACIYLYVDKTGKRLNVEAAETTPAAVEPDNPATETPALAKADN